LTLLPQISVPVHVIWGEEDRLVPAAELRRAALRLPDATLRELPNVGHMPIIEVPEEVVAFLRGALAIHARAA
jgi:abhydrolase domain-containing protein 6